MSHTAATGPKRQFGALTDADAGKLLNVGERSVERAKTVQRDAIPELTAAVERGEVSVSAAADVATKPKERKSAYRNFGTHPGGITHLSRNSRSGKT
jgi:hypothetical protein